MKQLKFIILLLAITGTTKAQIELDLTKCREMALEFSKQMSIANSQLDKANYDRKAYRANFFPRLSATGFYFYKPDALEYSLPGGYLPTYVPGPDGKLVPNVKLDPGTGRPIMGPDGNPVFNQYTFMPDMNIELGLEGVGMAGLQLEQPIYMGGKVRAAHEMAKVGTSMASENIRLKKAEVLTSTDEAYWQYVGVKEKVQAAVKYQELLTSLVETLNNSYETGMITRNDVLKAQVKLNEATLMLQKARNGLELSRMNLCRVIGLPLITDININDALEVSTANNMTADKEQLNNRPEYQLLEKEVKLKGKNVDLARSDFLPQLGVSASYSYFEGAQINGVSTSDNSFSAMASLKIPIFHWGEGKNKVRAAKVEQQMSQLKLEEMSDLMALEMAQMRFNLQDAFTQLNLADKALEQAQENLDMSKNQYELGMETLTNYLEAQAQWQNSWSDQIEAKANLKLSETRYLKAIGSLDQVADKLTL
ncbi:TolC family protein [Marinilabiliaceae bacterium JC017]|nr:TolC family protein [Marinilabiliaceae bacterium JC017]